MVRAPLVCILLWCSTAAADATGLVLTRARAQYSDQEYEKVIAIARTVVKGGRATVSQQVEAHELLGLSYLILGKQAHARAAFLQLLRLEPRHKLRDPSGSPKLKSFYDAVKASLPAVRPTTLRLQPTGKAVAGLRLSITAVLTGLRWSGHLALLRWRRQGQLTWRSTPVALHQSSILRASLLLPESVSGYRLQYYMAIHDADGVQVVSAATAQQPRTLQVAGVTRSRPLVKRWWFWVAVGVVVVGGATAGIVVLSSEDAPRGNMKPGIVQLP